MRSSWFVATATLGLLVLTSQPLLAQSNPYPARPGPIARPQLSPYLNLLRGGSESANYYLGVVPEFDRRRNARLFGNAIQDLERRVEQPGLTNADNLAPVLPATGHATYFLNYSNYYSLPGGAALGSTSQQTPQRHSARGR